MRSKLHTCTKGKIVSARISDGELENVRQLMELTNLTPSEIMRKAFHLQIERFKQTPIPDNPSL
jgi:hypothetical protein